MKRLIRWIKRNKEDIEDLATFLSFSFFLITVVYGFAFLQVIKN